MYTTLLVSIIGVCLNVFSGCDKPVAPTYHIGDIITQTVSVSSVSLETTVRHSNDVTMTITFRNEFKQDIVTSISFTSSVDAVYAAKFASMITSAIVSGKVSKAGLNSATITDASFVKVPSTTDKVLGAVSGAYTAVTSAVSSTTGHAVTSARNSLANSLIALAGKVASK